jgi:two-component system NtrC family response regulator
VVAQGQRLQHTRESLRSERLKVQRAAGPTLEQLLASPALAPIARQIRAAVHSSDPVLLTGESGTGKTLLAQLMAEASGNAPVVRAMLGTSDDLNTITSELFGHERGAFSGALARRVGLVEYADGGSLIFDEILNLPRAAQQLLLDFTQFGTYRPLGWARAQARQSRVRLICATNGDLEAAVAEGTFRSDLYYRIAGHRLQLPSLRSRRAEIPTLAREFLSRADPTRAWKLDGALLEWLSADAHQWPGNFRQLESTLRRAMSLALLEDRDGERLALAHVEPLPEVAARAAASAEVEAPSAPPSSWVEVQQQREALDAREREVLKAALARADGVVSRAARELGMPRTSLLSRMASLGLPPPPSPAGRLSCRAASSRSASWGAATSARSSRRSIARAERASP